MKTLVLPLCDINLILNALADRPYGDVAHLIENIKDQILRQEPLR